MSRRSAQPTENDNADCTGGRLKQHTQRKSSETNVGFKNKLEGQMSVGLHARELVGFHALNARWVANLVVSAVNQRCCRGTCRTGPFEKHQLQLTAFPITLSEPEAAALIAFSASSNFENSTMA
jgi:hypothetical protein